MELYPSNDNSLHHLIKLIIERESENKVQKSVKTENVFVAICRKDLMEEFTPENLSLSLFKKKKKK